MLVGRRPLSEREHAKLGEQGEDAAVGVELFVASCHLPAELFDNAEVPAAHCIGEHVRRPEDVSDLQHVQDALELGVIEHRAMHELHALRTSRVTGEHEGRRERVGEHGDSGACWIH